MSDECLFLQRNRSRGKEGCLFHNREREESIRDEILVGEALLVIYLCLDYQFGDRGFGSVC